MFAKYHNGKVVKIVDTLPQNDDFVSGLDKLSIAELANYEWYPVVEINPNYDPRIERRIGESYAFANGKIELTYIIAPIPLDDIKNNKIAEMSQACSKAITSGYMTSILGTTHFYPLDKQTDRDNILSLCAAAIAQKLVDPQSTSTYNIWCAENGVWQRKPHTVDQVIQLGREIRTFIDTQQDHYALRCSQIMACNTAAEVNAIVW